MSTGEPIRIEQCDSCGRSAHLPKAELQGSHRWTRILVNRYMIICPACLGTHPDWWQIYSHLALDTPDTN